jgi:hypothetical protein
MIEKLTRYANVSLPPDIVVMTAGFFLLTTIVLLFWWLIPRLMRCVADWRIRRHIKKLGNETLSNVRLPDGVDGDIYIDHLVLSGDKIIVVDVKRYDGLIYGSETLDTWMQVVNRRNFQFVNPLHQMRNNVIAVQAIVPDLNVEGAVLFVGRSYFPKRIPAGVLRLQDIPAHSKKAEVSGRAMRNWRQLQACMHRNSRS